MASLNKAILIGNLTRDPELRYTSSGQAMARFGLAMNRKFKSGDEWKEDVDFIDVVVWGKQAENTAEYLSKGRSVSIEGRISLSTWTASDGSKRSKHEVIAERVIFLGSGSGGGSGSSSSSDYSSSSSNEPPSDDDVPF